MTPDEQDALQQEQDKRDAIRRARLAKAAQPFLSEWYEFERNQTVNAFRLDNDIVVNPVKAIEYQQYLKALERVAMSCIAGQQAAAVETEDE